MEQLQKTRDELVKQYDDLCTQYDKLAEKSKIRLTAKTRTERIQDKVSEKIELKKLESRIEVLSRTIDAFDTSISLSKYGATSVSKLGTLLSTPETVNNELLALLESEYKQLDILSTKMVLVSEFKTERLKGLDKYYFGPIPMLFGVITAGIIGLPFYKIANLLFSSVNLLLSLCITGIVGAFGACYLMTKSTMEKISAFNNLNNQLGEEALAVENNDSYEEQIELEALVDKKIHDIMIILMDQKEYQRLMEVSTEQPNKEKNNSQSLNSTDKGVERTEFDTVIANSGRWAGYENIPSNYSSNIPRGFSSRTVIANSGRWAGYEDILSDYPSKIAREGSSRTERDDTVKPGILYRHIEYDDDDEPSQALDSHGLARKLSPKKYPENKQD